MNELKDEFLIEYSTKELNTITLPDRISDKYTIDACLKYTDEKQIYLILSKSEGESYILKRALLSSKEKVLGEYVILSSLQHPLIPKAIGYLEDSQYSYLIREYVSGDTLFETVEKYGAVSENKVIDIIISVCDIISCLHSQKPAVIHRDIKPQNIILTPEGTCKLIDMGTSRRYKDAEAQDTVFMGTQATAAPEQFGYRQTDQRSDIYGIGVLMVYLLTGSFQIENSLTNTISKPLKRIIAKCLEFDPDRRFKKVDILKSRLKFCSNMEKRNRRIRKISLSFIALTLVCLGIYYYATKPDLTKVVNFQSPLIEQAVRFELDKPENAPIMMGELDSVTQILICGDKVFSEWNRHHQYSEDHRVDDVPIQKRGTISELQDLKLLKNLHTLVLDNQNITDISVLKGLPLRKLSLCINRITDISPLKACRQLTCLKLESNPISDIRPISGLDSLDILDIGYSAVKDLSALKNLPIRELYLFNTKVEDFSPMKALPMLEMFRTRFMPPKGLRVVSELRTLKQLSIYDSSVDSMEYFEELINMENLDISSNELNDLSGVEKLIYLRHIGLGNNRIKSLAPLTQLSGLNSIDISYTDISDFTPLKDIPMLEYINCSENQEKQIREILGDTRYKITIR